VERRYESEEIFDAVEGVIDSMTTRVSILVAYCKSPQGQTLTINASEKPLWHVPPAKVIFAGVGGASDRIDINLKRREQKHAPEHQSHSIPST